MEGEWIPRQSPLVTNGAPGTPPAWEVVVQEPSENATVILTSHGRVDTYEGEHLVVAHHRHTVIHG